ncbi:hypothetical protein [Alkalibacillus silvisoli]|uniref:DUF4306 domain-containing protein n=1 Tax=Alkalibacillus silvisoli TaxID=392823 RepID=A0ABN1A687_9BACI
MDKRKLQIGCLIYIVFGVFITTMYFTFTDGDLFRSYFDWTDLFDAFFGSVHAFDNNPFNT